MRCECESTHPEHVCDWHLAYGYAYSGQADVERDAMAGCDCPVCDPLWKTGAVRGG